jgi:hypothetical protein
LSPTINAPQDPALAILWRLAMAREKAVLGRPPAEKAELHAVIDRYHDLLNKPRGSLSDIIRERCEKAPGGD